AAGDAVRHRERQGWAVPPSGVDRQQTLRADGERRGADGYRVPESYRAGAARRLAPRARAGYATGRTTAECRDPEGSSQRRETHDAAGTPRAAPQEPHLLLLPQRDGSVGLCARELRHGGTVPHAGYGYRRSGRYDGYSPGWDPDHRP